MIFLSKLWGHGPTRRSLAWFATAIIGILTLQIYLGALTIWTVKNPHVATAHMLLGAFLLASTWALTLVTHRLPIRASDAKAKRSEAPTAVPVTLQ